MPENQLESNTLWFHEWQIFFKECLLLDIGGHRVWWTVVGLNFKVYWTVHTVCFHWHTLLSTSWRLLAAHPPAFFLCHQGQRLTASRGDCTAGWWRTAHSVLGLTSASTSSPSWSWQWPPVVNIHKTHILTTTAEFIQCPAKGTVTEIFQVNTYIHALHLHTCACVCLHACAHSCELCV